MSSVDLMRPDQVNELKVQMKKWERKFEKDNGRKPKKDDIDKDEEIKQLYLIYWKMIKLLKRQESENNHKIKTTSKDAWNDSCKKKVIKQVDERKNSFVCRNKTLNLMSNKLLKNELQTKPSRLSYTLKKNKTRTDENKCIRINSNQVCLLKRQSSESVNDEFVNLIQNSKDQQLINIDYSSTGEARFTVETPLTLDLDSKVDETIVHKNSLDQVDNSIMICSTSSIDQQFSQTEFNQDQQHLIKPPVFSSNQQQINQDQQHLIKPPVFSSNQQQINQYDSNQPSENMLLHQVGFFNQSNQFTSFNNQQYNNQVNLPQQSNNYTLSEFQSQDDVDFGSLIPQLFENFNSTSREQCDTNYGSTQSSSNDQQEQQPSTYENYTDLATSSSTTSFHTNILDDFSPVKDIPAEKLTFSNFIKNFTNLESNNLFTNLHGKSPETDKQNEFQVGNQPGVYDFEYEPSTDSKVTKKKKLDVKELTKEKSKRRKKKPELNFKRLDIKKKNYSRGHKKFNMNKYKKDQWKKLQQENKCFKCGEKDHWAKDCTNVDKELKEMENDNFDELEEMASDQIIVNSAQPLFDQNDISNLQIEIQNAQNEFGFQNFRPNQKEVIERILMGRSVLMISSTGSGKSLCYQLPAFIFYKLKKYITIVISPLISLMEDQMLCLPKCLSAVCLHSGLTATIKKTNLNKIQSGEAQILFLSPEYILTHLFELSLLPTIGFVCIDEAHCLSEWSNNFRPSYLQFFNVLKETIKINTFLALTATANKTTTKQILKNIGMSFEQDVIGMTQIPNNLILTISRDSDKDFALISLLKSERFFNLNSIIIYCSRRETTEKIATLIRIEMQKSKDSNIDQEWSASAYHAGLTYQERKRIQKNFITGKLRVVVATIAFGMGINKSDVDGIIHFSLPKTIENYVQEIGRAGRNGKNAQCHIFLDHDSSDLFEQQRHIYSNGIDKINIKKLTSKLFKPCKCLKLRQIAEEEQMIVDQINDQSNRCSGHENSFSIKELTEEFDIKEETLLTILIYLELNLKNIKIKVMNKTFSTCILSCYKGGSEQLESLAQKHAFIGLPLAQLKKENPNLENQTVLKFSYINVASMLGQPSREVLKKLKCLEWKYEQNRKMRSNIRVAFDNLSFHIITPGDLNEQEIQQINQMIFNYSKSQEILEIKRLKQFYELLKESSQSKCTNKINSSKSLKLKKVLNDYFDLNGDQSNLPEEAYLENVESLDKISSQNVILKNSNNSEIEDARRDIRDLISIHSDQYFTPRAITRILQGISSPKYSAEVWGKDKRFWRKRIRMDFNLLYKLTNEELVRIKCSV